MGLKGNLAVVNLADVFQMLSRGKSSGLLRVQAPEGTRFIELQDGLISLAGRATQYIQLGDLLLSRKAINDENLSTAMKIHKENGMVLGQVLIEMNYVTKAALDESLHFLIEEEVCDLFTLREGEFDFLANASLDTKIAPGGGAVRMKIDPDVLLLEAARRADEWHEIEQRLTTQSLLFRLTDEGQRVYKDADGISDEGRVIMRLLQANHTVEGIVQKSCLGRLNSNRMVLELWDAQLIEAVPKNEYLHYAKLQMEAGQLADAHRIAVHASKVGSPDTIKTAIPLIDNIRRQMSSDEKPVAAPVVNKKEPSSATIKKPPVANLIIKRTRLPWAKIGIVALAFAAAGVGAYFYYFQGNNEHALAVSRLDGLKQQCFQLVYKRMFLDAVDKAKNFTTTDADLKLKHEQLKREIQIEIDSQFNRDFGDLIRGKPSAALEDYEHRLADYAGVAFENKQTTKYYKDIVKKIIPDWKESSRTDAFNSRLEQLRRNSGEMLPDQLMASYHQLLKDDPPETTAKLARAELYKLLSPGIEAQRQLSLAREAIEKGGFDIAQKINEGVKAQYPGTKAAAEADKNLQDLADQRLKASEDLAKIRKLILQRKTEEARRLAQQLLASRPPADVWSDALIEIRKLQEDVPEEELRQKLAGYVSHYDIDAKQSRAKILELVAKYPFSDAASNAMLHVQIDSSPTGATVVYKERIIGKTPFVFELPAIGPLMLTFTIAGYENVDLIENNFRGETIQAVFLRKPQASILVPVPATAGLLGLKDFVLVAGGNELTVCSSRSLEVLRRINLEAKPLAIRNSDNKTVEPPALAKGELHLRGLSANSDDAEAWAFVSCTGSYFFQIASNTTGTDFFRIPCEPGAIDAPQMYRPKKASSNKLMSVVTKSGIDIYNSERQFIVHKDIPSGGGQEQPLGYAFDGDMYYVPRDNNTLYAVEGYRGDVKWSKPADNRISMPPAVQLESHVVAISDVKGNVVIRDLDNNGKEKGHTALGVSNALGLAATTDGFIAALDDNSLALVPLAGGPPKWTAQLQGRALLTPRVFIPDKKQKGAIALAIVCCETQSSYYLVTAYNLADGSLVWRGRLAFKPIACSTGPDAVYIGTSESELLKFDYAPPGGY